MESVDGLRRGMESFDRFSAVMDFFDCFRRKGKL
jgi:hypothetical protein